MSDTPNDGEITVSHHDMDDDGDVDVTIIADETADVQPVNMDDEPNPESIVITEADAADDTPEPPADDDTVVVPPPPPPPPPTGGGNVPPPPPAGGTGTAFNPVGDFAGKHSFVDGYTATDTDATAGEHIKMV